MTTRTARSCPSGDDATARHDDDFVLLTVRTTKGEMQVRLKPSQAHALAFDLRTASYRASETRWALTRQCKDYDDDD